MWQNIFLLEDDISSKWANSECSNIKENLFFETSLDEKKFKCSFLNLLSLRSPGARLQAHSSGDGAFFFFFSERKEVGTHKLISLAVMPRMTLLSTHFFHKPLTKTNWRVKSSQFAFIKSCQNNGSASDGICFPGWPAWRGRGKWWISVYQLTWVRSSDAASSKAS